MSRLMDNNKNGILTMGMKYVLRGLLSLLLASQMALVGAAETITYYHNDALGSPVAATDEAGNLLWREAYRPYGSRLLKEDGGTNNTWYTGKQEDSGTGLSYFGARWYDPNIGRFMAIDPVGFNAGNIHSFNRYAYANNNPYKYVDPDGENPRIVYAISFGVTEKALVYTGLSISLGILGGQIYDFIHDKPNYLNENSKGEEGSTGSVDDLLVDTTPDNDHKKSPKTDQRKKGNGGGIDQANDDFDNVARPKNVKDRGNGIRTGELDDGSTITVRPKSSPTISINKPGKKQIKIRY